MAAARWAWEQGEAGRRRHRHPAQCRLDLPASAGRRGRARRRRRGAHAEARARTSERFVAALLDQGAVALERAEFAADAADAEALRRSDKLRSALLNSVSHDLRTPLSTVLGSATTLHRIRRDPRQAGPAPTCSLSIREEAERLNRYVGDLLDMTRLEGGGLDHPQRLGRRARRAAAPPSSG